MHHGQQLVLLASQRGLHFVGIQHFAHGRSSRSTCRANPAGHITQPLAEIAIDADQDVIVRLDEVDSAASIPAVPVPEIGMVSSFCVWNT